MPKPSRQGTYTDDSGTGYTFPFAILWKDGKQTIDLTEAYVVAIPENCLPSALAEALTQSNSIVRDGEGAAIVGDTETGLRAYAAATPRITADISWPDT